MKLEVERVTVHTIHPFRIARGVQTDANIFLFHLEDDGYHGVGEAAPPPYYGESEASVEAAAKRVEGKLEGDAGALKDSIAGGELHEALSHDASVRAALDVALWDIIGQREGKPVYEMLGLDPAETPATSYSIGIDTPEMVDKKVDEADAFHILKMKMGVPGDMALVDRVLARTGKTIRVDANEGWDLETALAMSNELSAKGIEFIEQPIHHDSEDDLKELKRLSGSPIILDESIINPEDVAARYQQGHGINIKLMKCGGITPALQLVDEARQRDMRVMLGCMLETSVGITAAAHISPLVDYADLDGNILLKDDPYAGVTVNNGKLILPDAPGLGVSKR